MHLYTEFLMLHAPHLNAPHAFTTRLGGVSSGVYGAPAGGGLNLDERLIGGLQDDPASVAENRRRALEPLGFALGALALLDQVHGTAVVEASPNKIQMADAHVSAEAGVVLGILTADCYPILLEDPQAGVVGAAHAGWKGSLGRIAERTVQAMQRLGARPERIRAAVGPGISAQQYAVGPEVAGKFAAAGFGTHLNGLQLDLAGVNAQVLREAGLSPQQIWLSGRCTCEPAFYSHRRDAGRTGRMLALIGVRA
ncbi:peptidoglycan editing factor PgeF [Deinococcus detaillensis]|uniref:Purine nucleoside phosphorylase n=1 Tax=Deinococcus detaillensis TaxID=2592048 RepID=A0A553UQZ5_9DEIO|nr:peptidoglycan editing factor PgeF [Deinococcus detaillensis]TSA82575.1 peptidoglycan editing factor PgeF [Deinococcus detaillensis]